MPDKDHSRLFFLLRAATLLVTLVLLLLAARNVKPDAAKFLPVEDEPTAVFDGSRRTLLRWLPRDYLYTEGARVRPPHSNAAEADYHLIQGRLARARETYHSACRADPGDVYSRFMLASLEAQRGDLEAASAACEELLLRAPMIRSVHVLSTLVAERRARPGEAWSRSYLRCLVQLGTETVFQELTGDLLYDMLELRLRSPAPLPQRAVADERLQWCLRLLGRDRQAAARAVLTTEGDAVLYLLAAHALVESTDPADADLLGEALDLLQQVEPDNAYPHFLAAQRLATDFFHLRLDDAEDGSFEVLRPPLPAAAADHLFEASRKPAFRSYARPIFAAVCAARRQAGDPLAEYHVPLPGEWIFPGHHSFPSSLLHRAMEPAPERDPYLTASLVHGAFALLEHWPALAEGPFDERRRIDPIQHAESLLALLPAESRRDTAALEQRMQRFASPVVLPRAAECVRRYLQVPPPIPDLVEEFLQDYAADATRLNRDLRSLLGS